MAQFTYQVDRLHRVTRPLAFNSRLTLDGEAVQLAPGAEVIYRGLIELAGVPRYTFEHEGRKLFTRDRGELEGALAERYDELVRV